MARRGYPPELRSEAKRSSKRSADAGPSAARGLSTLWVALKARSAVGLPALVEPSPAVVGDGLRVGAIALLTSQSSLQAADAIGESVDEDLVVHAHLHVGRGGTDEVASRALDPENEQPFVGEASSTDLQAGDPVSFAHTDACHTVVVAQVQQPRIVA